MRFVVPTLLSLGALVSARCGTVKNGNIEALHSAYQAYEATPTTQSTRRQETQYRINTYFYVITQNSTVAGGNVTTDTITAQMDVLNSAYNATGFSFVTIDTFYIPAPEWREIQPESETEYNMKRSLRHGNYSDLNIYIDSIAPTPEGAILGYATFPDRASKKAFALDGVVVDPRTLPNVSEPPYNMGITLVHEVGHWLSLFHTFESNGASEDPQAGCYGNGDYIMDTPAEGSAAFGCDVGRDSCPSSLERDNPSSAPGVDPIHNYMDYSNDACLNTFTQGQIQRMMTSFVDLRLNYVEGDEGEEIDIETPHVPHDS